MWVKGDGNKDVHLRRSDELNPSHLTAFHVDLYMHCKAACSSCCQMDKPHLDGEKEEVCGSLKFILELLLETFVYFKEIPANRFCSNLEL